MSKKITQSEKLQLLGLLALGIKHQKLVTEVEHAMNKITGDELGGHLNEAIYNEDFDIDTILENMEIGVEDATIKLHD